MVVITCLLLLVVPESGSREPEAGQELIERTLALVGGQAITLGDARAALALGLVPAPAAGDAVPAVTAALVDRELVLREVQRYQPPAPAESAVDARLDEVRRRFPADGALARALAAHGFTEFRLRAWVRDDLRAQAYLAQRFASASTPSDAEVSAAYLRQRAEFDAAGQTFEQAEPAIRERLANARRAELIVDWVADLRRRTDVLILVP